MANLCSADASSRSRSRSQRRCECKICDFYRYAYEWCRGALFAPVPGSQNATLHRVGSGSGHARVGFRLRLVCSRVCRYASFWGAHAPAPTSIHTKMQRHLFLLFYAPGAAALARRGGHKQRYRSSINMVLEDAPQVVALTASLPESTPARWRKSTKQWRRSGPLPYK